VTQAGDVAQAVRDLGADRVVLKAAGLLHKTEAGGVAMDLTSPEMAQDAAREMLGRLGSEALPFVLQKQCSGFEMLVGLQVERTLPAVVIVGWGGVHAEVHQDVARRVAPVTEHDARAMLRELRCWPLLSGYRGSAGHDVDALCKVIVGVARLAGQEPGIAELDLNPVMVGREGQGCSIVDARIIIRGNPLRTSRRRPDLHRMLRPRHLAVVGVSDDQAKAGARIFRYLAEHGYQGRVDPVHPAGGMVGGQTRYRSLSEVPGSPDLVCVAVPAAQAASVVREAVAVRAGAVVMHSSGFAEMGPAGENLQDELGGILGAAAIPFAGPNCMGVVAPPSGLAASISGGLQGALRAGDVALLTTSGGLGSCVATRLMSAGVGLSYWIHAGNEADVTIDDYLEWLSRDDGTKAVGLLIEDVKDGAGLVSAGRRVAAAGKPMFVFNMARSASGRRAALSHTGALVGSYEAREEVVRAAGMVSVPSVQCLEDALALCSASGLPAGPRLMVIAFSGGACTIVADEAERLGISLPEMSGSLRDVLRQHVPSLAAVRNPMDTSFEMLTKPESYQKALASLLRSGEYDAALVQFTTNADPDAERAAHATLAALRTSDLPVYISRFGAPQLAPRGLAVYADAGIPVLGTPNRAMEAIAALIGARSQLG
jgi:acyl-CoA synthetase (NDP forming)